MSAAKRPASAAPKSQFRCADDHAAVPSSLLAATLFAVRNKSEEPKLDASPTVHLRPSTTTDKLRIKKGVANKRRRARPATVPTSIVHCVLRRSVVGKCFASRPGPILAQSELHQKEGARRPDTAKSQEYSAFRTRGGPSSL